MTALDYILKQKRTHECALATARRRTRGDHVAEIQNLQEKIRCCEEIAEKLAPSKFCFNCEHFKNQRLTKRGAIIGECDCARQYTNPRYGSVRACRKYEKETNE